MFDVGAILQSNYNNYALYFCDVSSLTQMNIILKLFILNENELYVWKYNYMYTGRLFEVYLGIRKSPNVHYPMQLNAYKTKFKNLFDIFDRNTTLTLNLFPFCKNM